MKSSREVSSRRRWPKVVLRSLSAILLALVCQTMCAYEYSGKAWDEIVDDEDRPALKTNDAGNYVITIKTPHQLAWYAWKTRTETNVSELSKYIHADIFLGASIDMKDYSWRGIGEKGDANRDFQGTFDGQGHTISNLVCERFNDDEYAGLFDQLRNSVEIRNVKFFKCKSYAPDDAAGIVVGGVYSTSNVKFTNLTFDECFVQAGDYDGGIVVGRIMKSTDIVFDNITIRKCEFSQSCGERYGGIAGCLGWGDNSVTVRNSFINLINRKQNTLTRMACITGYMDHSSRLDVDNCVFDLSGDFFTGNNDQGAIVGRWDGSSKPMVRRTLVLGKQKLPTSNGSNAGLFAGYTGSSSAMELSDCFINRDMSVNLNAYQLVSDDIVKGNKCLVRNVLNIDRGVADANEAGAVVQMNRNGACFGINRDYKKSSDDINFVIPLSDASKGKLLGFSGKDRVASVSGDGFSGDLTLSEAYNYVVMPQGQTMKYTANKDNNKWIINDLSTNISDKKRVGKWEFSGIPSAEGELKFEMVDRPKASMITNLCSYNSTLHRVTLTWQVQNGDVFKKYWKDYGKWYIYRKIDNNNEVLIDSVESSKDTWTDFAPVDGKKNTYNIYFVCRSYLYEKGDNNTYPNWGNSVKQELVLEVSSPIISNGKVVNSVGIPNASSLNGCRVRLLKWDTATDIDCKQDISTIISKADELKVYQGQFLYNQLKDDEYLYMSYEDDKEAGSLCTSYYYLWLVDNFPEGPFKNSSYHSDKLNLINDAGVKFNSFSATKGKSTSKVYLKWNTENKNNESLRYVIERKAYDETSDYWTQVYETSSSLNSGSYEDEVLPGYVYRYRIRLYPFCDTYESSSDAKSEANDIGFAASRGTIQGRVTFSSGDNTVEGVDVRLQSDEDELAMSMPSYAMLFSETDRTMPLAGGLGNDFWDGEWTIQFLLFPNEGNSGNRLLTVPGRIFVNLDKGSGETIACLNGNKSFSIPVNDGTYQGNYIVLQHDSNGYRLGKIVYDNDSQKASTIWTDISAKDVGGEKTETLWFGRYNGSNSFKGAVDEVRVWDGCLSEKSLADTYNRYLSGNEKGLMAYYTFDSGVSEYAFDSSHPSGNWNNRDMELPNNRPTLTPECIPESNVLAYRSTTDSNGEYTISGIPFEGEGTNWQIVPSLGAHDFSPSSTRRLVSTSALAHSNINFTDISSFRVSGKVYYENTNIPVQGCNIMVDGVAVSEGSAMAETNYDGEFSVDVPIGTHTLSMNMNGHTFTDSLTMYFNKPVKDLWFYDNTKVIVAGRICGGELEYAQPIGLEQSKNNIGTAYITLAPSNANYYFTAETDRNRLYIVPSARQIDYSNPLKYNNNSWAHTGNAVSETDMGDANRIYIKTDSLTGEFAACLPPMRYEVVSITIPSADDEINRKLQQNLSYLDARNVTDVLTDSVWNGQITPEGEPVYDKFEYNTIFKVMVTTPAVLEVWQDEDDRNFFGEDTVTYFVSEGKEEKYVAYKDGAYTIGAVDSENRPVFNQFENYVFYIRASQKYYNRDDRNNIVEDLMPMAYKTVTVNNTMAYENYWYVDENGVTGFVESDGMELELDSVGCGIYKFK
ncbi:MAG: LamG domain-containing protein, partial [Bacteroidaceae bacterium]|nr:LamG domain-containing protein [Bacteroidaceae bacterium]